MDLYQLKCVLVVAKHMNFTKAASELCITPPALSQQIKRIEKELNVQLFERTTRSVKILPAGRDLTQHANKVMSELSSLNESMQKYADGTVGTLVIGCVPLLKEYGIIHWIRSFVDEYTNISIEFREDECLNLYPALYKDEIDLALLTSPANFKPNDVHLKSYPLACDELVIAVSKEHSLGKKRVIQLTELENDEFIRFNHSSSLHQETLSACHEVGFQPRFTKFQTGSVDIALGLVAENAGVALLPKNQIDTMHEKNIQLLHIKPKIKRTFLMVFSRNNKKENSIARNFKDFIYNRCDLPLVCQD